MPVMLALTEGQVPMSLKMAIRSDQKSIIPLSLSKFVSVRSDMQRFSWPLTVSWLVTIDSVPVDVAACNLFARKLNFFARAALPLLSIIAAVSTVAGATGLSHTHIGLSDTTPLSYGWKSRTNLVMCLLEFSSEKIPTFHSYFRSYLLIFILIQFLFLN